MSTVSESFGTSLSCLRVARASVSTAGRTQNRRDSYPLGRVACSNSRLEASEAVSEPSIASQKRRTGGGILPSQLFE
eukprot:487164-Rhodomonas_salina.3